MTRKTDVTECFILRGEDSTASPFLRREFIWPSCDSPAHRKYIESLLTRLRDRLNGRGYKLEVQFQTLNENGIWTDAEQP